MPSEVPHPRGGKFQSKAQQRMWFARYGQKAGREVAHNTAPARYRGNHPINAAGIPDRVSKAGTWINPMHGTEASRKALRAAANAVEESAFRRAKPKLPRYPGAGTAIGKRHVEVSKGVKPTIARVNPTTIFRPRQQKPITRAIIGKSEVAKFGGFGEIKNGLKAVRRMKSVDMAVGGFRAGAKGMAKPKVGLRTASALPSSKPLQTIGSAAKWTGEHRVPVGIGSGIVGGSVVGAGLAHHSDREMVDKAYGDPEDARYARLGAGATLLGGAGAAATGLGVRQIHQDTKRERNVRNNLGHDIDPGPKPTEYKPGQHSVGGPTHKDWMRYQKLMAEKKKLEAVRGSRLKGIVVRGRSGAMLGGGLAALAGAEGLRRKATERRWN